MSKNRGERWRHSQFARVASYIGDERRVYTGPRHRRKQEALRDLDEIQSEFESVCKKLQESGSSLSETDLEAAADGAIHFYSEWSGGAIEQSKRFFRRGLINSIRRSVKESKSGPQEQQSR